MPADGGASQAKKRGAGESEQLAGRDVDVDCEGRVDPGLGDFGTARIKLVGAFANGALRGERRWTPIHWRGSDARHTFRSRVLGS